MIATDDSSLIGTRRLLGGDVICGVDLETVGMRRPVARRMQRMHMENVAVAQAFQEAAAFDGMCGSRSGAQCLYQRRCEVNAERQCAP